MLPTTLLLALLATPWPTLSLPLNINLGAYSPALVVGDGEISFGNAERAGEVMETLASGAAVAGNAGGQQQSGQPAGEQPQPQQAPPPAEGAAAAPPPEAEAAAAGTGAGAEGESASPPPPPEPRIRYHATPNVKSKREDSLPSLPPPSSHTKQLIARDIQGFREALNYAGEAMKNTPKLEIGSENAGVGIVQNAGTNVASNSASNGQLPGSQPGQGAQGQAPAAARRRDLALDGGNGGGEGGKSGITLLAIAEV
ncbi:MAG: hypothetical protein Q9227_002072 [Pyrenula ochraceoflavens]